MAINANSLVNGTGKRRMRGMRPFAPSHVLLPLFLAATTLAACDEPNVRISSTSTDAGARGVLKVVEALQCPETQGVLTRKGSARPGGKVCTYTGPKGAEVSLHLVDLKGAPSSQVLRSFENQLAQDLPPLWQAQGTTAMLVTHSVDEAVMLSDRIVVLSPRPARIVADIEVPLAHPRSPGVSETPSFRRLVAQALAALAQGGGPAQVLAAQ